MKTDQQKCVVKVFSNERTDEMAKNLANRACVAYENGVCCPKIFKINDDNLLVITINNIKYRILVMEYIDGADFFSLKQLPSEEELKTIAKQLAMLNNIEYNPEFIYDKWAIVNFENEYNKNISLVEDEYRKLIEEVYSKFKRCDFSKLKKGYVHGDIIETNVIKGKNGKLYFIDFSVSNYLPRLVDLAVTICDLCLDLDDIEQSKKRIELFVNAYEESFPLSEYEKEALPLFFEVHQSITILQTTREKLLEHNDTLEN